MTRVVVVSSIRLYRDGLAEIVDREADLTVVGTFARGPDDVECLAAVVADVVLVDLGTPDGLEFLHGVAQRCPNAKLVALGLPETEKHVVACAEAGAVGYVPREATIEDLLIAIRAAARGEASCSPRVAAGLFRQLARRARRNSSDVPESRMNLLTRREHEVVALIEEGLSNKEIATRLGIELTTVKNHVHNLLEKLRVHRRGQVAALLLRRGWSASTDRLTAP